MELDKTQLINYLLGPTVRDVELNMSRLCLEKLNLYLAQPDGLINTYPIILVTGTNGKGSVCAYLSTILTHAGYTVGSFSSPHVLDYNERICLNNQAITDSILVDALNQVITICNEVSTQNTNINLGLFKTFALAAHLIFSKKPIDIAIFEVGIGGKYDITNLFDPLISAITNVSFDHQAVLGSTLESIAANKAGIFRSNRSCFYGSLNPPQSVLDTATKLKANLQIFGTDFHINMHEHSFDVLCNDKNYFGLPIPSMRGKAQAQNVALAVAILNTLKIQFPVSLGAIKAGISTTTLMGRFQVLPGVPQVVLDVAHNSAAVSDMLENMLKLPFAEHSYAVFGIADDKDIQQIALMCSTKFDHWFIVKLPNERGLDSAKIAAALEEHGVAINTISVCGTVSDAYHQAIAMSTKRDNIVCFGSFVIVAETIRTINALTKL